MLFIRKEQQSHAYKIVHARKFEDVELPLSLENEEAIHELVETYNELQAYLAQVYAFINQRAYQAAAQLEIPKCLRTIAEARVAAPDDVTPSAPDSEALSSGT